ncbi:MAG: hypothetical protein J6Z11_12360 [Candidatus Riflebacteria bacterium]|nr:hypothetical protein [Candidatus Riflebacteria bacterium]
MENYFTNELKNLQKELLNLKTSKQKSAGQLTFYETSTPISVPLSLNQTQIFATGKTIYRLTPNTDLLFFITLDWYYTDISKANLVPRQTRTLAVRKWIENNYIMISIMGYGTQGQNSDVETLKNGGSVVLTATMNIRATDLFNLEKIL